MRTSVIMDLSAYKRNPVILGFPFQSLGLRIVTVYHIEQGEENGKEFRGVERGKR